MTLHARQFAGLGLEQCAFAADDVAQSQPLNCCVPSPETRCDKDWIRPERPECWQSWPCHDALQHDAAGDLDFDRRGFEFLARLAL